MLPPLPVEKTFETFVVKCGGELVSNLIPNINPPKNADYLFRTAGVLAELKVVKRDAVTIEDMRKLDAIGSSWVQRRLIPPVYGRTKVALRALPLRCQQEWLRLHERPWKRRLRNANKQIKAMKSALNVPDACGILFIADDANDSPHPNDAFTLIARVLKAQKDDGSEIYSNIDRIVYFSVNPRGTMPDGGDLNYWFSSYRYKSDQAISQFLKDFGERWIEYHSALFGEKTVRRIRFGTTSN